MTFFSNIIIKLYDWFYLLGNLAYFLKFKDILDILFVSLFIYFVLVFIKQSRSFIITYVILLYVIVTYLAKTLELTLTRQLFQFLATLFLLVFVIVFQRELRRFFDWVIISSRKLAGAGRNFVSQDIAHVVMRSIQEMASKKIGALIVFPGSLPLEGLVEGGFPLDGRISSSLLLSIFDTSSPGHDGAVIIENNRLRKFGVHLPLAENYNNFNKAGTRHRAAVGLTERSDSLVIAVSEERGEISIAQNGQLVLIEEPHELEEKLKLFLQESQSPNVDRFWRIFWWHNWRLKALALIVSFSLWFFMIFQMGVVSKEFLVPVEVRYLDKKMQVASIEPRAIKLTFMGSNRDLNNFTQDEVKVFIDLKGAISGSREVILTKENIVFPSYLDLTKMTPKQVKLKLEPLDY